MSGKSSPVKCNYCRQGNQHGGKRGDVSARSVVLCTCSETERCNDTNCRWGVGKKRAGRRRQWYVRDSQGAKWKVGVWEDGSFRPGTLADAFAELKKLDEPGSCVVSSQGVLMEERDLEYYD